MAFFIGLGIFLILSFNIMINNINFVSQNISNFTGNEIMRQEFVIYFLSWLILFSVYFAITGLDKKSSMFFLYSDPFSREEIKRNQILFLFIINIFICLTYAYIFICVSYRNKDIIMYISNYYKMFIKDISRLFISGTAFISYIILMDTLFSSVVLEIIIIITEPFLFFIGINLANSVCINLSGLDISQSTIIRKIYEIIYCIYGYFVGEIKPEYYKYTELQTIPFIFILILSMFILAWFLNKSAKINNSNKLFIIEKAQVIVEFSFISVLVLFFANILIKILFEGNYLNITKGTSNAISYIVLLSNFILIGALVKFANKRLKKYI